MSAARPWSSHLPDGQAFDPSAGGLDSVTAAWARHWEADPDRVALLAGQGRTLRYGELEAASRRIAGRWLGAGLAPGDRVLFCAAASLELAVAHVACLRAGLVAVPANTAYSDAELATLLADARPRAALVDDPGRAARLADQDPALCVVGPEVDLRDAPAERLDAAGRAAPALIGYTSGTTGRPKGAVLSHGHLLAGAEALRLTWRWSPDDRLVLALPLFHMHGLGVGLHGTLHAGASARLLPRFESEAVFDAIRTHSATLFFGVPTMYHRLVEAERARELAGLRLCISGSAPLPAELHRRFEAVTGQRILERYGMTETMMLASNPVEAERRPGTVGWPLPGVELRLVGEPSEIQVRGPNVFVGYWERPEATREAFTSDGWFRTGDLGTRDTSGYLEVAGRCKELVISGGFNVYPREVEDALRAHPEIAEVAVVGTPSEEWGELVTAYVEAPRDVSVAELRDFLTDRLAPYKHPRRVHRVAALPRNSLGKVQKHRLREGRVLPETREGA